MGLSKTIQTILAAALLRRRRETRPVLVIFPASVKYEWKTGIDRFSDPSARVTDGRQTKRQKPSESSEFFNSRNCERIQNDMEHIRNFGPDLIVPDEAQRIRN